MNEIILYRGIGGSISVEIKDRCLFIFDHIFSGEMEKECWYDFDESNTNRVIELLTNNESDFEEVLLKNYSGVNGFERLKKFFIDNGIEYKYRSYSSIS